MRCIVERELDAGYQLVRSRKPLDLDHRTIVKQTVHQQMLKTKARKRPKQRAASMGAG